MIIDTRNAIFYLFVQPLFPRLKRSHPWTLCCLAREKEIELLDKDIEILVVTDDEFEDDDITYYSRIKYFGNFARNLGKRSGVPHYPQNKLVSTLRGIGRK
mmetsp:Transcript_5805/g.12231  ORF Transcript_5805/g.12231 Transcript_5805/m.12231 type:complete len:101 (+) Transcript_5805:1334-1636(+)